MPAAWRGASGTGLTPGQRGPVRPAGQACWHTLKRLHCSSLNDRYLPRQPPGSSGLLQATGHGGVQGTARFQLILSAGQSQDHLLEEELPVGVTPPSPTLWLRQGTPWPRAASSGWCRGSSASTAVGNGPRRRCCPRAPVGTGRGCVLLPPRLPRVWAGFPREMTPSSALHDTLQTSHPVPRGAGEGDAALWDCWGCDQLFPVWDWGHRCCSSCSDRVTASTKLSLSARSSARRESPGGSPRSPLVALQGQTPHLLGPQ